MERRGKVGSDDEQSGVGTHARMECGERGDGELSTAFLRTKVQDSHTGQLASRDTLREGGTM